MFKLKIGPERIYEMVNTGNATMFETLKIKQSGYTLSDWDEGYAKLTALIVNPEESITTEDLFNDGAFLISVCISVWIARLRAGENLTFDESTQDWSFADFKLIVPEVSQFAKQKGEGEPSDPKKPERATRKASAPAKRPRKTKIKGSGRKI